MKRIVSVLAVLAIMVAMLVVAAMPAFAAPNCEHGQFQAAGNAFDRGDIVLGNKHLDNAVACTLDVPPGHA